MFAGIGVGEQQKGARAAGALNQLERLRRETIAWAREHRDDSGEQAQLIADVASVTIGCARSTLDQARQLTNDTLGLLRRWRGAKQSVAELAGRPDWLLDGWAQICLLWDNAKDATDKQVALPEMALLAPVIPREASEWIGLNLKTDSSRFRRAIVLNEDWRTGAKIVFELIARNEHLRALAA